MASDSRSNASLDEVNVCQKMHTIVDAGECVFILLTIGNLSCSQSILTLVRRDFDQGKGLASASSMYDAAQIVGEQVRTAADMDQPNLNKHNTDIIRFGLGRLSWKKGCLRRASKFWRRRYERLHHPHPSQADPLRHLSRRIPGQVGAAERLSHGGAGLCRRAFASGQKQCGLARRFSI